MLSVIGLVAALLLVSRSYVACWSYLLGESHTLYCHNNCFANN